MNDIRNNFPFPIIIKKNSGSRGELVLACDTDQELKDAIQAIFDQASSSYDFILLAQERIVIKKEFRVTVWQKKIVLIYEKDFADARFVGNLSPLHWEGARAKIVEDNQLENQIGRFIEPLFRKLDLQYGGLDIALDENDQFCLFEINTEPGYTILSASYGDAPLVELYTKMLTALGAR
jgi:glutathione synthase/RimK-type ligase-like ATP-grasp enzyme